MDLAHRFVKLSHDDIMTIPEVCLLRSKFYRHILALVSAARASGNGSLGALFGGTANPREYLCSFRRVVTRCRHRPTETVAGKAF
jgi:hypothetical protein